MTPFRWDRLSADQARVLRVVQPHVGKPNAIALSEVARKTGINMRSCQDLMKELIEGHGIPVGTSMSKPAGWYLCKDADELAANKASFEKRAVSILNRAKAFDPQRHPHLAELFQGQRSLVGLREGDRVQHVLTGETFKISRIEHHHSAVSVRNKAGKLMELSHMQVKLLEGESNG